MVIVNYSHLIRILNLILTEFLILLILQLQFFMEQSESEEKN